MTGFSRAPYFNDLACRPPRLSRLTGLILHLRRGAVIPLRVASGGGRVIPGLSYALLLVYAEGLAGAAHLDGEGVKP